MKSYTHLVREAITLFHIRGMVEVYEELAAMRLSAIRTEIMQNRAFFEQLEQLAQEVGADTETAANPAPKKDAVLLVTANEGLYGDIIERTFRQFSTFIAARDMDIFVIGKMGTQLLHEYAPNKPFTPIALSDTHIDKKTVTGVTNLLLPYRTIHVFYGKFHSIALQNIIMSTLTGEVIDTNAAQTLLKAHLMYLYEPSLASVSTLFGTEIKASVFEQILQESQLAKHASRMMHLDAAIEHIDESLAELAQNKRQSLKKINQQKQQARIAGLFARGGRI